MTQLWSKGAVLAGLGLVLGGQAVALEGAEEPGPPEDVERM